MSQRDAAAEQLREYKKSAANTACITTGAGNPVPSKTATLTVGPQGPVLLQDHVLIDEMSHFDRERIPERVVHAKGAGAFGYFEVTHDITKYTKACLFSEIGKRTDLVVRFSTVGGESGSADTVRDPRGFAVKFYTEQGVWDLVGNNTPIFFVRDPILFPSFIHTQKRNPVTHLKDADMFWDFMSLRPESTHQAMILFSDRGIPDGYRHMNGYGSHTFKLVNANGEAFWCKFHYKTNQKIKNLPVAKANELASSDPDYSIRDLYNAIHNGNFPSWTMYVQIMTLEEAKTYKYNPFDLTKVWPHSDFPLIPVGKIVLNRNPTNYFTDVEQAAFAPDHLIPGIEPSPDKMLQEQLATLGLCAPFYRGYKSGKNVGMSEEKEEIVDEVAGIISVWLRNVRWEMIGLCTGPALDALYKMHHTSNFVWCIAPHGTLARLFAYSDTHRHRLGPNHLQLPVNCPYRVSVANQQRDGPQCYYNQGGAPNYFPNSFGGPEECPVAKIDPYAVHGTVDRYNSGDENNFEQPQSFWRNVLSEEERERMVQNIIDNLKNAADFIQERAVKNFAKVDADFGSRLKGGLQIANKSKANL